LRPVLRRQARGLRVPAGAGAGGAGPPTKSRSVGPGTTSGAGRPVLWTVILGGAGSIPVSHRSRRRRQNAPRRANAAPRGTRRRGAAHGAAAFRRAGPGAGGRPFAFVA